MIDMPTHELIHSYIKNKNMIITPDTLFEKFPALPNGVEYIEKNKDQMILRVNTEKIGTQKALQEITKLFEIDDINIENESLEDIIRGIYEKD